jgi:hypothetical protein
MTPQIDQETVTEADLVPQKKHIKQKQLFYFMPEAIVCLKPDPNCSDNEEILKSITPYFYWCAAHEFPDAKPEYRYLIQHQIYYVEGQEIDGGDVFQKWSGNKAEIRNCLTDFIDLWTEHKRVLVDPFLIANAENKSLIFDELNYCDFATAVGFTIFSFRGAYYKQVAAAKLDILQKDFWRIMALTPPDEIVPAPAPKAKRGRPSKKAPVVPKLEQEDAK